jgi:hypothetical protein
MRLDSLKRAIKVQWIVPALLAIVTIALAVHLTLDAGGVAGELADPPRTRSWVDVVGFTLGYGLGQLMAQYALVVLSATTWLVMRREERRWVPVLLVLAALSVLAVLTHVWPAWSEPAFVLAQGALVLLAVALSVVQLAAAVGRWRARGIVVLALLQLTACAGRTLHPARPLVTFAYESTAPTTSGGLLTGRVFTERLARALGANVIDTIPREDLWSAASSGLELDTPLPEGDMPGLGGFVHADRAIVLRIAEHAGQVIVQARLAFSRPPTTARVLAEVRAASRDAAIASLARTVALDSTWRSPSRVPR